MPFYDTAAAYDSGLFYDNPTPNTRTRMAQIRLDFKNKTPEEKRDLCQAIASAMTGNANFTTPIPTLATLNTAITTASTNIASTTAKEMAWRQSIPVRDGSVDALVDFATQLAAYVQAASGGDEAKILSSGFQVRSAPEPIGILPAPINFLAKAGKLPSTIDLKWKAVDGASSYVIECKEHDTPQPWQQIKIATGSRITATGLTSGKTYAFRVAAVGAAGQGPWSDETVLMAP